MKSVALLKARTTLILGLAMLGIGLALALARPDSSFSLEIPFVGKFKLTAPAQASVTPHAVSAADSKTTYKDPGGRFVFEKLAPPQWGSPRTAHGPAGVARLQGVTLNGKPLAQLGAKQIARLPEAIRTLYGFLKQEEFLFVAQPRSVTAQAGPLKFKLRNAFAVSVLPRAVNREVSLAEFVGDYMFYLGLISIKVERLTGREGQILVTGSVHAPGVMVNGHRETVDVEHGYYFVSTADHFFVVEIIFSRQAGAGFGPLDDLQRALGSFKATAS